MDHPMRALIHLDRLAHNLELLRELARGRPVWPAIKANAYGHGAVPIARELVARGCDTLCVAHPGEALELVESGVRARFLLMTAALPDASESIAAHGFEPAICTRETAEALARAAERAGRRVDVHVKVDTGMGRIGIRPEEAPAFLAHCRALPALRVRGLMSHFPRADEADKSFSREQIQAFAKLREATLGSEIEVYHMANSAALFDLPESHFDAVRIGISLYGLAPSPAIANPRVRELLPVLEWTTRISFLKEVPAETGLSYGHDFVASKPLLVATVPVGYGDGLRRRLSNQLEVLVGGVRCPQLGRITMDQMLVDVSALRGRVGLGDPVVLLGRQGDHTIGADEWARRLGTISYEITTALSTRVPRLPVRGDREAADSPAGPELRPPPTRGVASGGGPA
jgi:alanine racemase